MVGAIPALTNAQQAGATAAAVVFDGVTVVDVEQGTLRPTQRVVIVGNRIHTVGDASAVTLPQGAQVVDARGKYLIPGLWDLHTHPMRWTEVFYPLFLANGVTGIRDAGSPVSLDTLLRWRQEILAGTRIGPPRQLLSGPSLNISTTGTCDRNEQRQGDRPGTCILDSADARHVVDSLKTAGADMIKPHSLPAGLYFVIAAEARRLGIPFGGHLNSYNWPGADSLAAMASDSGATLIDHLGFGSAGEVDTLCGGPTASVARCQPLAERFRRNGTWMVPTLDNYRRLHGPASQRLLERFHEVSAKFLADSLPPGNWLRDAASGPMTGAGSLSIAHRVGLPILAATDVSTFFMHAQLPGFELPVELAILVAEGLTPLEALQAATLNPAKMLRATDSLGTVAAGKLADLVLLDADPLADITNTTTIRAVVANGRYFDRAALDQLLAEARPKVPRP